MKKYQALKIIEVFSGSGNLSRSFSEQGFQVVSIDKRKRINKCEPTHRLDVSKMAVSDKIFTNATLLWFGLPCTAWSNASGNYHINSDGLFVSDVAMSSHYLLCHVLEIIAYHKPKFWVIENPRGRLQNQKVLRTFLSENSGVVLNFSMGSFGFASQKPSQLFTNWNDLKMPRSLPYGRGNKSTKNMSNLTKHGRQSYPITFCKFIVYSLTEKISKK